MDLLKEHSFVLLGFFVGVFFILPLSVRGGSFPDSTRCWVELKCVVSGLDILLDGEKVGQTPLPLLSVSAGFHTLQVRHPDRLDWLSRDWKRDVFLRPGERIILVVKFTKNHWVGSDPSGASVFFGDRWMGKTPMEVKLYPDSLGILMLKKPGYEDYRVDLYRSPFSLVHVRLKKESMKKVWERGPPRLKKKWIVVSGVVALLSGAAGYYFKQRADRAYEKYMSSGHPDEMDRYFADAATFDKLTGVFYGLGEVSFGVSLLFLIQGVRLN